MSAEQFDYVLGLVDHTFHDYVDVYVQGRIVVIRHRRTTLYAVWTPLTTLSCFTDASSKPYLANSYSEQFVWQYSTIYQHVPGRELCKLHYSKNRLFTVTENVNKTITNKRTHERTNKHDRSQYLLSDSELVNTRSTNQWLVASRRCVDRQSDTRYRWSCGSVPS